MHCRAAAAQEGKGSLWDVLRAGGAGQVPHGTSCVSAGSWELHLSGASPELSFPWGSGLLALLLLHTGTADTVPWEGRILRDLCALALAFLGLQRTEGWRLGLVAGGDPLKMEVLPFQRPLSVVFLLCVPQKDQKFWSEVLAQLTAGATGAHQRWELVSQCSRGFLQGLKGEG